MKTNGQGSGLPPLISSVAEQPSGILIDVMKIKFYLIMGTILVLSMAAQSSQITNSVEITTNLLFYMDTMGTPGPQSRFKSNEEIIWGILGTSTNNVSYRHCPCGNFDFHLFDENGREIPKTKAGLDFTATPCKPKRADLDSRKYMPYYVDKDGGEFRDLFRPEDMFVITNKGIYEMEVRIRLCVIMTNGLPDLKAMIDWRNATGRGLPFAKDFGIVTSSPLRVKIVKE